MNKNGNPSVEELLNSGSYTMTASLNHQEIKEFVVNRLLEGGRMVRVYMIYQMLMILTGIFFITRAIVLAVQGIYAPLYFSGATLLFVFTGLILIHELIHGIALKLTGARKISIGGYLRKFIFYAEADHHVLNRRQFAFVALAPLFFVKILSVAGIVLFRNHPEMYIFWVIMCAHSLFCAGDLGLLSYFGQFQTTDMYTFDSKAEKTSYFFIRTTENFETPEAVGP